MIAIASRKALALASKPAVRTQLACVSVGRERFQGKTSSSEWHTKNWNDREKISMLPAQGWHAFLEWKTFQSRYFFIMFPSDSRWEDFFVCRCNLFITRSISIHSSLDSMVSLRRTWVDLCSLMLRFIYKSCSLWFFVHISLSTTAGQTQRLPQRNTQHGECGNE